MKKCHSWIYYLGVIGAMIEPGRRQLANSTHGIANSTHGRSKHL